MWVPKLMPSTLKNSINLSLKDRCRNLGFLPILTSSLYFSRRLSCQISLCIAGNIVIAQKDNDPVWILCEILTFCWARFFKPFWVDVFLKHFRKYFVSSLYYLHRNAYLLLESTVGSVQNCAEIYLRFSDCARSVHVVLMRAYIFPPHTYHAISPTLTSVVYLLTLYTYWMMSICWLVERELYSPHATDMNNENPWNLVSGEELSVQGVNSWLCMSLDVQSISVCWFMTVWQW